MSHWTDRRFWSDATWRAFRTFLQTLGALLGANAANILHADWLPMVTTAAGAALSSLIMSVDRDRAATSAPVQPEVVATPPLYPPADLGMGTNGRVNRVPVTVGDAAP